MEIGKLEIGDLSFNLQSLISNQLLNKKRPLQNFAKTV